MKRTELLTLAQPLTEKLYQVAFSIIPDDLQAEQLVIDAFNAFLIKEGKNLLRQQVDVTSKRETLLHRKTLFKQILKNLCDIGLRRSVQLSEQFRLDEQHEYKSFFALDPKTRMILRLRYDLQLNTDDIEDILGVPRFEVIEKLHNGRFLLMNDLNKDMSL